MAIDNNVNFPNISATNSAQNTAATKKAEESADNSSSTVFTSSETTGDITSLSSSGTEVTPENIEEKKNELKAKQKELEENEEKLKQIQNRKKATQSELDKLQADYDLANAQIENYTQLIEDIQKQAQEEVQAAAKKYNPETDGDFNSFISKYTPDVSVDISIYETLIKGQQSIANSFSAQISNLQVELRSLSDYENRISLDSIALKSSISTLSNKINTCEKAMNETSTSPSSDTTASSITIQLSDSTLANLHSNNSAADYKQDSVNPETPANGTKPASIPNQTQNIDQGQTATLNDFNISDPKVKETMLNLTSAISNGSITLEELSDFVAFETSKPELRVKLDSAVLTFDLTDPKVKNTVDNLIKGMSSGDITLDELKKFVDFETFKGPSEVGKTEGVGGVTDVKPTEKPEDVKPAVKTAMEVLKGLIDEKEFALVEKNKLDLTATDKNGLPKYIIAKGQKDGKFHIYEKLSGGSYQGVARKYAERSGYDIVTSGNGNFYSGSSKVLQNTDLYNKAQTDLDQATLEGLKAGKEGCDKVYVLTSENTLTEVKTCYSTSSPLNFDLEGDGIKTSNEIIDFDIDGDGTMDKINNSKDAVLVFDADGDGISGEDGSELFGDNTDLDGDGKADSFKNGFDALKALANKAGLINGKDDMKLDQNDLKLLEEQYGLKIKTEGYLDEAKSLFDLNITEIDLAMTDEVNLAKDFDGLQNDLMTQEGATFKINGETREYADLWHSKKDDQGQTIMEFITLKNKS